jgi:hypothetical protein
MLFLLIVFVGMFACIPLILFPFELFTHLRSRKRGVPQYLLPFLVIVIPILLFIFVPSLKAKTPDFTSPSTMEAVLIFVWYGLIFGVFLLDANRANKGFVMTAKERAEYASTQIPKPANEGATEEQKRLRIDELVKRDGFYGPAFQIALKESWHDDPDGHLLNYLARSLLQVIKDKDTKPKQAMYAIDVLRQIKENAVILDATLSNAIEDIINH